MSIMGRKRTKAFSAEALELKEEALEETLKDVSTKTLFCLLCQERVSRVVGDVKTGL